MKVKGIVKQWRFPEASERELARNIQRAVAKLVELMRRKTHAMKFDATDAEITDAEQEAQDYAKELVAALIGLLPALAVTVYKFNTKQWINVAKSAGGAKNQSVMLLIAIGATQSEPWYQESRDQWESMSAAAINKLFTNIIDDWAGNVRNANFTNKTTAQVNELADKRFAVYNSWASNRATGIVGSWNSRLMRQRLADARVTHYFWHGMLDDRERLQHLQWEGKRIALNAIHDFPGEPYGCRCWAVPDFEKQGD
nr:head morphogenesis [Klebsiella phage vB_Kpn_K50PH164C1]